MDSTRRDRGDMVFETETIIQVKKWLQESGSIASFEYIQQVLAKESLTLEQKLEMIDLVITKVQEFIRHGNFRELKGAKELLSFLGVEKVEVSSEYVNLLSNLYSQFSYSFLIDLSPTLYNGRLNHHDGPVYERVEYTRKKLQEIGAPPEQLTTEFINSLWGVREVLIRMHSHRVQLPHDLTMGNLLLTLENVD